MTNIAKVLFLDIESTPLIGMAWEKRDTDLLHVVKDRHILCFGYKWFGESKTKVLSLPDYDTYKKDPTNDKELLLEIRELLDQADIVCGHNAQDFDLKIINARMAVHNIPPPAPYTIIDTLKSSRKYFGFTSNKLNDLGISLGLGEKESTGGFQLWLGCMAGDKKAWAKMTKYNKRDVDLLEQVYLKLRPWIGNHPLVSPLGGHSSCKACGSSDMQKRGFTFAKFKPRQRLRCNSCGHWNVGEILKVNV